MQPISLRPFAIATAALLFSAPVLAQTAEDTYDALVATMSQIAAPGLSDAVAIHDAIAALPSLDGLSNTIRNQVQRDLDREEARFFLRFSETITRQYSADPDAQSDGPGLTEVLAVLLDPGFGPGRGLFENGQYRARIDALLKIHAFRRAFAGDAPLALRAFDAGSTCPLIEDRAIPFHDSLELLFGLPFAFWDRPMVERAMGDLQGCGRVGQDFAAALEQGRRTIMARAQVVRGALAWRADVLSTAPTPAALAQAGWFDVPRQFEGQPLNQSDSQMVFGPSYQQAVQQIVAATIDGVTATIAGGGLTRDQLTDWCASNIPESRGNSNRRLVFNACVSAQRTQISQLDEQARTAEIEAALDTLRAEAAVILAVPDTLDGARAANWLTSSPVSRTIPRDRRQDVAAIMDPVTEHVRNVRIGIGREMSERLQQTGTDPRTRISLTPEDCGLPPDIPTSSPLFDLYGDCRTMIGNMANEARSGLCRATFAQAENPQALRRARLTHPMMPAGMNIAVEEFLCHRTFLTGEVTVTLRPTRSWLWDGYNITVSHEDIEVTGRLVADDAVPGAWTVTHLDMPGIDRAAQRENNIDCFMQPRGCLAGR